MKLFNLALNTVMNSMFKQRFLHVLNEADGLEDREDAAMAATLDKDTDPTEFDTKANISVANIQLKQAMSERETRMLTTVRGWVDEMTEFLEFLNGQDPNSVQSQLGQAEPDTLLDKMKSSEQRKIARVATEIAALAESFKGYVAQAGNPSLKYV